MDHGVRSILGACPELQQRNNFGEGSERDPQPQPVRPAQQPRAQLVEVHVREMQPLKGAIVQRCAVFPRSHQPSRDGRVPMPEHPHGRGDIHPLRQRRQHLANPVGCRFKPIERGVAWRAEARATCLTAQRLDALAPPLSAIAHQGMDLRIGDRILQACAVGAGEALGVTAFRCAAPAFPLAPGRHGGIRWGGACPGRHLLAAGWASVWGAWFQEALTLRSDRG